ncbi:MAG: hypothetical protein LBJ22_03500 [Synergistaceae bacterium]|jgi:GNAT superfamily N-acetyltransferase|nr:hypothetical protein [Synergistaceae bacterium]
MNGHVDWLLPDDISTLVELHSVYLNFGDGITPHFVPILRDAKNVCLKYADENGEMGGLLIYVEGISLSGGHLDICRRIEEMTGGAETYTCDAVLLKRKYRGGGVSALLYRRAKEELIRKGARYVLHELWVLPDGVIPARRLPETFGETTDLGLFENFYKDFDHYGYYCPICKGKCACSARLYLSKVV